jgi:hypothetical protein
MILNNIRQGLLTASMISRIIFTGDPFRTIDGRTNQSSNVEWLIKNFGALFSHLTDAPSELALPFASNSTSEWRALQGCPIGLTGWAETFWSEPTEAFISEMAHSTAGALVVSIEMPPVMQAALDAIGVPWIDIGISPIRFLQDYVTHVKHSFHFNIDLLHVYLLNEDFIKNSVLLIKNYYRNNIEIFYDTLVFFAQTSHDRTLIRKNGDFVSTEEALKFIDTILEGRKLIVKEHPWEQGTPSTQALISEFGGELCNFNTYAMLAAEQSYEVATLSSSVGKEAPWFGKPTTIAHPEVQNWAFSGFDLLQFARSELFWGPFLATAGIGGKSDFRDSDWQPNGLRSTLREQGLYSGIWS